MNRKEVAWRIFFIVILTYLFMLSIKLLGTSFKLFGSGFAEKLVTLTTNPFIGLFIGILATALVQSSSVTTSLIVGLTASNALTIGNAIPMVMGANIGTSVTNTFVSLAHIKNKKEFKRAFEVATVHDFFNLIAVIIFFPLELYFHFIEKSAIYISKIVLGSNLSASFSSPLDFVLNPVSHLIKNLFSSNPYIILIFSVILLYFSLNFFVKTIKPIAESEFKHKIHEHIFSRPLRSFSFGLLLTVVVQSSSITTSLIVPLAGTGIVSLESIFPYIIGANIGTTFTAVLAAIASGSTAGAVVATSHVLFNVFGAILVFPIRKVPITLSRKLASICMNSRFFAILYIVLLFYLIPVLVIFLFN